MDTLDAFGDDIHPKNCHRTQCHNPVLLPCPPTHPLSPSYTFQPCYKCFPYILTLSPYNLPMTYVHLRLLAPIQRQRESPIWGVVKKETIGCQQLIVMEHSCENSTAVRPPGPGPSPASQLCSASAQ